MPCSILPTHSRWNDGSSIGSNRNCAAEKLTDSKTGVQDIEWASDSKRIAYVATRDATADEDRKVKEKDDAIEVDHNFVPARLSVYDVTARTSREIVKGDYQIIQMAWSPDGSRIS